MAITRNIEIDGRPVLFRASAALPRLYRIKYRRDLFRDLVKLQKSLEENDSENSGLDTSTLEQFENIAFLMAKHADPSIPDTPEEWLDGFAFLSIYKVLPQIFEMWQQNLETQIEVKKNSVPPNGK